MQKKLLVWVKLIAIITLIFELSRQTIFLFTSDVIFPLFLAASISISVAALFTRLFIIDPQKFTSIILETDINDSNIKSNEKSLNPTRFLNLMPVAMVTCSIADIFIHFLFELGMVIFLLAQIIYITAYSGIIHLNPKTLITGKIKSLALGSTIGWFLVITIIYFTLIYSPDDSTTLLVTPYVVILTIMAIITFFALGYTARALEFRSMLAGGAICFVISDALLAYDRFNSTSKS
ncbi:MAG: lysoplasmalogenase family protein [Promethearchaeota archaeon]